jgi:protease-4
VYAVVQDLCASGGYYIAVAADRIYVDKASLVGSIGVIMGGFGFVGAIEKLGIERRAYTSGDNKDFLDPFQPENPKHREHAKQMLGEIHQQFIKVVRQGRGNRLKDSPEIFSGLIWTGEKSIELGLSDALGSAEFVAREVVKAEKLVDFTPEENYFERLSKTFGTSFGQTLGRAAAEAATRSNLELR